MLNTQVSAHLRRRAAALLGNRLDEILADYLFPLPVDLGDTRLVVQGPEQARAILALQRQSLSDCSIVTLRPRVAAISLPQVGRYRVWVDWTEQGSCGAPDRHASVVYYCRGDGTELRIEMVHYTRLAAPDLQSCIEALAPTA